MSLADQQDFMDSFEDMEDFWYDKVKAEYDANKPLPSVGDGKIDLKEFE